MRRRRRAPRVPPRSILSALLAREQGRLPHAAFRAAAYSALVPSATFANVAAVPPVTLRRFTPCGRYLVAMAPNHRDLVVFRLEAGGRRSTTATSTGLDFARAAFQPCVSPSEPLDFRPDPPHPSTASDTAHHHTPFLSDRSSAFGHPALPASGLLSTLPVPLRAGLPAATPSPLMNHAPPRRAREDVSRLHSCHFSRFFTQLYQVPIALHSEHLLREFCLATPRGSHIILASYHPRDEEPQVPTPPTPERNTPAVSSVPVLDSFTLHLVHVASGLVVDRFTLLQDFVSLDGHAGVHMRGDMLCVLSIRHQVLHIIKVQETLGRFTEEARIGTMCQPDDELVISHATEAEVVFRRRAQEAKCHRAFSSGRLLGQPGPSSAHVMQPLHASEGLEQLPARVTGEGESDPADAQDGDPVTEQLAALNRAPVEAPPMETGMGGGKLRSGFYTGLMQRLLVYVYRKYHGDGNQSLFYRVVGQYSLLVMLKAQFLDEDHLLIRLGSQERSTKPSDSAQTNTCFFLVYCISSTKILNLFENRSTELLGIYEKYRDVFIGDAAVSATLLPTRSSLREQSEENDGNAISIGGSMDVQVSRHGASGDGRDWNQRGRRAGALREQRTSSLKRTRAELSALPVSCQTGNVSAYLDRELFSYNSERMAGLDGTRAVSLRDVNAVKFLGARSGRLRFKLAPGLAAVAAGGRVRSQEAAGSAAVRRKRRALFLFHPSLPFVVSMEFNVLSPTLYNFHVYGFRE